MLVRCSLDGAVTPKREGDTQFMTCMALNEFDPKVTGVDWRRKLDTQRGAVLANELKNNSNKLGRWTARSFLAGACVVSVYRGGGGGGGGGGGRVAPVCGRGGGGGGVGGGG
eukprot:COSAG02_NODE_12766_length_1498_cov_1.195854_1_plen_111_part_10